MSVNDKERMRSEITKVEEKVKALNRVMSPYAFLDCLLIWAIPLLLCMDIGCITPYVLELYGTVYLC